MHTTINGRSLELVQGDITEQAVDAIVNAANSSLAGGGGVDGAIHRRGGPNIMDETDRKYPEGCPTGSAVISGAGLLLAKYVIHAVGPVWRGGQAGESTMLRSAYERSFELASEHECVSIALPAISTGVYNYPLADASRIAIEAACSVLRGRTSLQLVRFVLFSNTALEAFSAGLADLTNSQSAQ